MLAARSNPSIFGEFVTRTLGYVAGCRLRCYGFGVGVRANQVAAPLTALRHAREHVANAAP
eukprot:6214121-Pleurochrysis_carterae.AAC.3